MLEGTNTTIEYFCIVHCSIKQTEVVIMHID